MNSNLADEHSSETPSAQRLLPETHRDKVTAWNMANLYCHDANLTKASRKPRLPIPLINALAEAEISFEGALSALGVSSGHLRAACRRAGRQLLSTDAHAPIGARHSESASKNVNTREEKDMNDAAEAIPEEERTKSLHVALVHDYFWTEDHCYETAPQEQHESRFEELVGGYHAIAFGDNHQGFTTKLDGVSVINCGTMMRRKVDEKEYQPQIGLLCKSGQIIVNKINTSADKFLEKEEPRPGKARTSRADLENILYGLDELDHKHFDFIMAMEYTLDTRKVDNRVKQIILEAIGRD